MGALTLATADAFGLDVLAAAFNRAFTGYFYPLTQTPGSLAAMVAETDVSLPDSLVALDPAGAAVGIALLAARPPRGWIAGVGLDPAWRGRGEARELMRALIERARTRGLRRLHLEVLDQNERALHLYARLGFAPLRPLTIFAGPLAPRPARARPGEGERPVPLAPAEALDRFAPLHPADPAWQREEPSLRRHASDLRALGLREGATLAAYVLYGSSRAGIPVLDAGASAPTAEARRGQIALLLRAMTTGRPHVALRAINVPPGDPLGDALRELGCPMGGAQREMVLEIVP
jgi:GNAT superfamily N-acetyltransferase